MRGHKLSIFIENKKINLYNYRIFYNRDWLRKLHFPKAIKV